MMVSGWGSSSRPKAARYVLSLFLVFALGEDDAVNGGLSDGPVGVCDLFDVAAHSASLPVGAITGAFALVSLRVPTGREAEGVLHAGVVY